MTDQLRERLDAPIWNAIEANNFKQALRLVDKRLAKKHTDYLEALKIYIRSRSPQVSEKSAVLLHLEELLERKLPLLDIEAVALYEEALDEVLPESNETWERVFGQLRWQCVTASPKNEDLALKCFKACFSKGALDHARQIANSLEKNFPKKQEYIFWNITMMFLFSTSKHCPENQKKIWGGLALGQMGKLAAATREAQDQKQLPIRSIQNPQELLLLDRVTEAYGKPEQRLEYLQAPHLGPESAAAKGEWQLWRTKLQLMEAAQKWQELFETTGSLLKRARTKDEESQLPESRLSDWLIWEAYIKSAVELGSIQHIKDVRAEVGAHLEPESGIDKSWKRNASLANVKLAFESSSAFYSSQDFITANDGASEKIVALVKYLEGYGTATTAYNDLRPFVENLVPEDRTQFLVLMEKKFEDKISTAGQITLHINVSKLKYLMTCALPQYERSRVLRGGSTQADFKCISCSKPCSLTCKSCLEHAASNSIRSYRMAMDDDGQISKALLKTDQHPADDLCILAATCLIKLSLIKSESSTETLQRIETTYALQAAVLLENAWTHSKYSFQISLLLIRLYSYLGCGSLAMRAYRRLGLKQIQLDTLSYTVFDRLSSLHPHPSSQFTDSFLKQRTLLEHLQKQQNIYKSARESIAKNSWLSFKNGSYNSIFEMREVSYMLSHSMAAAMSVVESRKISRLTEPGTPLTEISNGYALLPPNAEDPETGLSDNLDYHSFPNFETSHGPRFEELSRYLPSLSADRCRANLVAEKIMLIVDPSSNLPQKQEVLHLWLKQYLDSQKESQNAKLGMTRSEDLAAATYHIVALILRASRDSDRWKEDTFQGSLEKLMNKDLAEKLEVQRALIDALQGLVPAFGSTLHALYTAHEVGRTVVNLCIYLSKQSKDFVAKQKEANTKVRELAQKLLQLVVEKCALVKKGLDEGGWIDKVLESTLPETQDGGSELLVGGLRELLDENFVEAWAGEVVESWRDSVIGFSFLKAPAPKS